MESIIGVQVRRKEKATRKMNFKIYKWQLLMCYVVLARSISIEFSSGDSKTKDIEDEEMYEVEKSREDKNEGMYKLFIILTKS